MIQLTSYNSEKMHGSILTLTIISLLAGCQGQQQNTSAQSDEQAAVIEQKNTQREAQTQTNTSAEVQTKSKSSQENEIRFNHPRIENVAGLNHESLAPAQMQQVRHRIGAVYPPMPMPPILPPKPMPPQFENEQARENYLKNEQNPVKQVMLEPVSTFSIDVDTGSYSNSRRMIKMGKRPPADAVREEAFINYFDYHYSAPKSLETPFNVHTEVAPAPWNNQRQLLKIGIKGFDIEKAELKAANLVFLLDVSGSMNAPDKLPLLKSSLTMLTKQLDENDSVAIVVYAGAAGLVLPATKGNEYQVISNALNNLSAGGSTNGAQGIELAYQIASQNFKKEGINRVILATDGDFNVGMSSVDALKKLIANKRKTGIALTTLGFGQGNYNDGLMEQLANIGNGQHAYIDTINEARKVLVDELSSTMQIIAKDVKIQVEFNPAQVAEYRLIGYQNRLLKQEDFNNDTVDAGELGAGHTVTALYEITLANSPAKQIDDLRYQTPQQMPTNSDFSSAQDELAYVKLRYKAPNSDVSKLMSQAIFASETQSQFAQASQDFQFAATVAGFADKLKGEKYTGLWQYQQLIDVAVANKGDDPFGYRNEFIQLLRTAAELE
ncbi:vWA domain-containing protein [Pseudoalteromonas tunicata]|uniref:vWA domain-containing protein n=1 Tax=Pseudoalteromonas tunicata TaxID=314281 RepID=UPI00273F1574|nr:VWA domain-containing protein [Pseudoalteromonas tunicata]MDP4983877.1 VWA domain-containing protein [Pseudoalteromonas tunicata]MDP5214668.1 VWA domain-containing protein [Pseudoalteromonas tunicata]